PEVIRKTGVRSVAIFHDAVELRLPQLSNNDRKRFHNYLKSLAAFDLVVCISQESHDDLLRWWDEFALAAPATCVEPWPTEFDEQVRESDSAELGNMIACICSFEPRKNQVTLLAAAEKLWSDGIDFELQLVGRTTLYSARRMIPALWRLRKRGRSVRWLRHVTD